MSDHFPTTRNEFLASFLRQYFSLPDSMIYYITKNPSSSKVYQKLIQTCKYFFIKNPILVIHCLQFRDNEWTTCTIRDNCEKMEFHQRIAIPNLSNCKLWIEHQIKICYNDSNAAADLAPKIYQCDAECLVFGHQKITFHQFLFYAKKVKCMLLGSCIISSDGGSETSLEEIFANLPLISKFNYCEPRNVSFDIAKKLLQIPHFKNIEEFQLFSVSQEFDIDPIYNYYKKNRSRFTFSITFIKIFSIDFAKKLDGIVDEILDYKPHEYISPYLTHPELDHAKGWALYYLGKK